MQLGDYLNAMTFSKQNIIRESESRTTAEKMYPRFMINRMLSYHHDCILYVNDLNTRGLSGNSISNIMHFEYFLHSLKKRKRYSKLARPEKEQKIQVLMEYYKYSYEKAKQVSVLFDDVKMEKIKEEMFIGGTK